MRVFVEIAALVGLLGGVCTLTGRLLALVFRMRLLRRPGPETLVASAFLGTGFLVLAFGWGSHAGLPAKSCLLLVGALLAALLTCLLLRGELRELFRLPAGRVCLAAVVLALGVRVGVTLLPLLVGRIYYLYSDAMAYVAVADWLQAHGLGTPAPVDAPHPVDFVVGHLQGMNHRMGPMFLLALAKAALPGRLSVELFPVVMAWGAALNIGGVFLLGRWSFGLTRYLSAVGAFLAAAAFNSLCTSTEQGFLCQVYGTAVLAFALALLSRLLAPVHWRFGNAVLLGIALATQVSVYSELSPVLALAGLASAAWVVRRQKCSPRRRRLARFVGLVLAAVVVFGNIEVVRAARGVLVMTRLNGVGHHVAWGGADYARFAVGCYPFHIFADPQPEEWPHQAAVILAGASLVVGAASLIRRRRALPVAAALLVLAGLAAYFRLAARDPWTGEVGHTWNLFKICKWSFAVVSAAEAAGLALLVRLVPWRRAALALACLALAWATLPHHVAEAKRVVEGVRRQGGTQATLPDLKRLRARVDELNPSSLYLLAAPDGPWPRCLAGYLFYPRPFVSGWKGSGGPGFFEGAGLLDDRIEAIRPDTLFLLHGEPPFGDPKERLPSVFTAVDGTRPLIFRVDCENGVEHWAPGGMVWLDARPAALWAFAPRAGPAVLSFHLRPGPSLPGTARRTLRFTDTSGDARDITVEADAGTTVTFPVHHLPAGVSRLEIVCLDAPTAAVPGDGRVLLVGVMAARLDPVAGSPREDGR